MLGNTKINWMAGSFDVKRILGVWTVNCACTINTSPPLTVRMLISSIHQNAQHKLCRKLLISTFTPDLSNHPSKWLRIVGKLSLGAASKVHSALTSLSASCIATEICGWTGFVPLGQAKEQLLLITYLSRWRVRAHRRSTDVFPWQEFGSGFSSVSSLLCTSVRGRRKCKWAGRKPSRTPRCTHLLLDEGIFSACEKRLQIKFLGCLQYFHCFSAVD